ncbi:MAG: quinol monooxygenase YgiN [Saprospiraceae bacterium]|jgi:quinol monooxygenase YgiN
MSDAESKAVHLKGFIDVPQERLKDITAALPLHLKLTLAEPGCNYFNVAPSSEKLGRFTVDESFVNQAAFEAHQSRNRQSDWYQVTAGIPRSYEVTVGEKVTSKV